MEPITKQLFKDIEKRLQIEGYGPGSSHPINILINNQDAIIEAYQVFNVIVEKKNNAQKIVKEIDDLIEPINKEESN